ncbi:MAG: TSUP family transporter [Microlunatus sp.]|nr:TSUP family transporter [Microlunatus sp.]
MSWLVIAGLGAAVLVGATTMRATGMGFALANVCGTVSALLNLTQVHHHVDWRRARFLIPAGVIGCVPGAVAVRLLPTAVLTIAVSIIVLVGLGIIVLARNLTLANSPVVAGAGGLASGFMNVTAGVGGPGLVIYAIATDWKHSSFAATAQVYFAVLGVAALTMKQALPSLSVSGWLVLAGALGIGLLGGNVLAPHIDPRTGMRLVIIIAAVGASLSLAQGLASLS